MSPNEYLELAERYREALTMAMSAFTRFHLEAMERSYRTLAESELALQKSGWIPDPPGKLSNGGEREEP